MAALEGQRFVVDTNVLISYLLLPSSSASKALRIVLTMGELLVSNATLAELAQVIQHPKFDKYLSNQDRKRFFEVLAPLCIPVEIIQPIHACRDPKDVKFLEVAINGSANFILTGDRDLLALHPFHDIPILSPSQYLRQNQ